MASSSRLFGQVLSLPISRFGHRYNALPTRAARYATSSSTVTNGEVVEEDQAAATAMPDLSVYKGADRRRYTPSVDATIKRKKPKARRSATIGPTLFTADTKSAFPHLPSVRYWQDAFQLNKRWDVFHRSIVANTNSIERIVEALDLPGRRKAAGRKLTILECYPGPGTLTRRLLQDENVEKVIAMEDHAGFHGWLEMLYADESLGENGKKLQIINDSSYNWETWNEIVDDGHLDHIPAIKEMRAEKQKAPQGFGEDWKAASPLVLVGQLATTVQAEQLIAQFTSAIARRYWLFRFSRMPMFFMCSEHLAWRSVAQPGHRLRSRMSVLTQVTSEPRMLLNSDHFTPHEDHFWPHTHTAGPRLPRTSDGMRSNLAGSLSEYGQCLMAYEPRAEIPLSGREVDAFEHILTSLFVLRANTVKHALARVAPGAVNLLGAIKKGHPSMTELGHIDIDPGTIVYELKNMELVALAKMFERWPFKPQAFYKFGPNESAEDDTLVV